MKKALPYLLIAIVAIGAVMIVYLLQNNNAAHLPPDLAMAANIEYCGDTEVCPDYRHDRTEVWCPSSPECLVVAGDTCQCNLYRDKRGDGERQWEKLGGPLEKSPYEPSDYNYACWCTE